MTYPEAQNGNTNIQQEIINWGQAFLSSPKRGRRRSLSRPIGSGKTGQNEDVSSVVQSWTIDDEAVKSASDQIVTELKSAKHYRTRGNVIKSEVCNEQRVQ